MAKKFTGKRGKIKIRKTYKFMNVVGTTPKYRLADKDIIDSLYAPADDAIIWDANLNTGIWEKYKLSTGKEINKEIKVSAAALYTAREVAEKSNKPLSTILRAWSDLGEVVIPDRYWDVYGQDMVNMANILADHYVDQMVLDGLADVAEYAESTFEDPEQAIMFMYGLSDVEPTETDWDVAEQDWDHHNLTIEGTALCQVIRKIVDEFDSAYASKIFDEKWNIKSLRESIGNDSETIAKILDEAEELIREQRR
jgi:hypothetical protein